MRYSFVGYDSTTYRMSHVPVSIVTKEVAARLSSESKSAAQPRLWYDGVLSANDIYPPDPEDPSLYATASPTSINTGVSRYHTMRVNNSVQCDLVARYSFPRTRPGPFTFHVNLSLSSREGENNPAFGTANISISRCVPGNFSAPPWARSRDRRDITDIDVTIPEDSYSYGAFNRSFTTCCSANTTRGNFELPNSHNNFIPGHLLEKWIGTELDGNSSI
ncbi:hypothetical protein RRF57_001561 [Xylaria bambusicola]|uniref:Uncharacterized protein n=1 Tax=Xylaria bambusicola TaxID=326684 RepID=A0AAN7U535_9PEZI